MAASSKIYYDPLSVARRTQQVLHYVQEHDKQAMLYHLLQNHVGKKTVLLVKSKRRADELSKFLLEKGVR